MNNSIQVYDLEKRVSIIVPIYNVEKYLRECLDSLVLQTFKDIEVILVNDGSTDGSADIAREYCDKYRWFSLIDRPNGGLSAARNTGLDVAKGEYVYFIDSDDYLAHDAIKRLYERAKRDDLDSLKFSAYCFEDGTDSFSWSHENGYKYAGDYSGVYNGIEFYNMAMNSGDYYPSCCLVLMRREVIENSGLRFAEGIVHEDNLFNFEFTSLCRRIAVMNEPLYYRRVHPGSITQHPDWLNKNRSLCVGAELTDAFISEHQGNINAIGNLIMAYYFNMMLYYWEQMARKIQNSDESKECFDRVKPLLRKYGNVELSAKLFYISPLLYKIYRRGRTIAGKVLHGN